MVSEKSRLHVHDRETEEERRYWLGKLSGERGASGLVLDYERPRDYFHEPDSVGVALPDDLFRKLLALTNDSSFLIYATLLTALNIYLHKYTDDTTVVVGSPPRRAGEDVFVSPNALAVVSQVEPRFTVKELLLKTREGLLEAYARQNYPFERLVRHLGLDQVENRCALFDLALVLEDIHGPLADVRNDLTITFARTPQALAGTIEFNRALFKRETVEQLRDCFLRVLRQALERPGAPVSEIDLLDEDERRGLLARWGAAGGGRAPESGVHRLFEAQAADAPDAVALVCGDAELTYGELNRRANQLAHHLRGRGVGPEVRVGLCVERSPLMLTGLLGILKAGGAYVPLDPAYPKERLAFILNDAGVRVLLTQERLVGALPAGAPEVIALDTAWGEIEREGAENPAGGAGGDNLVYLNYTSGSTGTPKGVMISHGALAARVLSMARSYGLGAGDRVLQFVSLSFDAVCEEIYPTLAGGAALVLHPNPSELPPGELLRQCELLKVTTLHIPPSYWHPMIDEWVAADKLVPAWVKLFITGGESLSPARLAHWLRRTLHPSRVVNAYGPTEATVTATAYEVPPDADAVARLARLPIGVPVEGTTAYLLDAQMRPVPAGVPGELYIGGVGLARGYHRLPAATAEKFVPHPFGAEPGARLYRTGDRARRLPDGNLDFLGRADDQVKIRGFRVELGEVEAALARHPAVRDAAVVTREDRLGGQQLVAYLVAAAGGRGLPAGELRRFVQAALPEHMTPSNFVWLDALPLSANGKVDRRALPPPEQSRAEPRDSFVAPRTPAERMLAEIFAGILRLEEVGAEDDFFELGGHSLLATQVVSRVREVFQTEIPVRSVFEAPTVAELALRVEEARRQAQGSAAPPLLPAPRDGDLPLSFAQQRLWFLHQLDPASPSYNFPAALRLSGQLNVPALRATLGAIVRRHESLRTTFAAADGQPVQVIHPKLDLGMPVADLSEVAADAREAEVRRLVAGESLRPFDLERGPLVRALLLKLGDEEHVLALTMHHIVTDGWSLEIFARETLALYGAFAAGRESPLEELPLQYADYARWQRGWLRGEVLDEQLAYWGRQLGGAPALLELPTDRPRPPAPSGRGANCSFTLPAALSDGLKSLGQREEATLFMTLLAAFQLLLHSYSGADKVVVGTNIANRNRAETEGLIGFFVNNLALCTDLSGNPTFRELLGRVRETTLGAYDHQDLPFEKVLESLRLERHPSVPAFFQTFFVLQNVPLSGLQLPGLSLSTVEVQGGTSKFDLGLYMIESGREIHGVMEYSTDLFDAPTVERLLDEFRRLLEEAVADPDRDLSTLAGLAETEAALLISDFNSNLELS